MLLYHPSDRPSRARRLDAATNDPNPILQVFFMYFFSFSLMALKSLQCVLIRSVATPSSRHRRTLRARVPSVAVAVVLVRVLVRVARRRRRARVCRPSSRTCARRVRSIARSIDRSFVRSRGRSHTQRGRARARPRRDTRRARARVKASARRWVGGHVLGRVTSQRRARVGGERERGRGRADAQVFLFAREHVGKRFGERSWRRIELLDGIR